LAVFAISASRCLVRRCSATPRLLVVLHRNEGVARLGHAAEAQDLDRRRRTRFLDALALVAHHGAHTAVLRTAHEGVAGPERPLLHQHGRHRAAAAVEACLDDRPLGEPARAGLELEDVRLQ